MKKLFVIFLVVVVIVIGGVLYGVFTSSKKLVTVKEYPTEHAEKLIEKRHAEKELGLRLTTAFDMSAEPIVLPKDVFKNCSKIVCALEIQPLMVYDNYFTNVVGLKFLAKGEFLGGRFVTRKIEGIDNLPVRAGDVPGLTVDISNLYPMASLKKDGKIIQRKVFAVLLTSGLDTRKYLIEAHCGE